MEAIIFQAKVRNEGK